MAHFTIKLGSFLTDSSIYPPNKSPISFNKDTVSWKNKSYLFDGYMAGNEAESLKKQLFSSITQLNFLGFNASLMICGCNDTQTQSSTLSNLIGNIFDHLQNETAEGVLRLCANIEIECFEIFADSQIRDLFALENNPETVTLRLREVESGVSVDGLVKRNCLDAIGVIDSLKEALRQQTVLVSLPIPNLSIVPNSVEEKLYSPKVVGPASHIFINFKIKQFLYVSASKRIVQLDSSLQIVSLASSDHLGIHGTSTEAISFMTYQQYDETYNIQNNQKVTAKVRDLKQSHFGAQDIKKNLQQSAFKALSTLTRVVQLLGAKYEISQSQESYLKAMLNKSSQNVKPRRKLLVDKEHIPFRDSLLTRLLQNSLQGNCAQFFLTMIQSDVPELPLSSLRFASSLYRLYNVISSTKTFVTFHDFQHICAQLNAPCTYISPLLTADTFSALRSTEEDAIDALGNLIFLKFGDQKKFPVKNFSDFERAILEVRNDLQRISDFCEEMDSYLEGKQEAEESTFAILEDTRRRSLTLPAMRPFVYTVDDTSAPPLLHPAESPSRPARRESLVNAGMSPPPQFTRSETSPSSQALQRLRRLASFELHVSPAAAGYEDVAPLQPRRIQPPQQRTSLPDLSHFLLKNGVSSFHESLPDIITPTAGSNRPRKKSALSKLKSASVDASLLEANNIELTKVVRLFRKKSFSSSEDDEGGFLREGERSFFRAISCGVTQAAEEAVRAGVSVHVKNSFGRDALQVAARNGSLELMIKLADLGASIHTLGPEEETLFHIAGSNGHLHVLLWLLSQGLNPESVNNKGQTTAHIAARRGELQVIKFLHFYCHVDFTVLDYDNKTPLQSVPRSGPDNIPEMKQFLTMITAPSGTKDLYIFVLEREMMSLKRHLVKSGLLSVAAAQEMRG